MLVGVPREIKVHEYRVGLTPGSARELVAAGHQVLVETGAGSGIGVDDDAYVRVGAAIAATAADVFARADMIVKVKEPQPSEWVMLRPDQILFTYLHLAPDPEQARGLMRSGCTAIAYETIVDERGGLPLLAPMSEVAGRLSIEAAGAALRRHAGGPGILLGGVPGVSASRVVVGADVSIIDASLPRLRQLDELFGGRVRTRLSTMDAIEEEISEADATIGAVLIPGKAAPKLVTRKMLGLMKRHAVLIDVAIDQGGCFETSRPTTHDEPTFIVDDIIHYCVANMPGAVPRTSSYALNNATLPYALALANDGLGALERSPGFKEGLNIHHGAIANMSVAQSLGDFDQHELVH
jgi:alanine dehydrogenase